MPCTPISERASRTTSSLNGLMIAVTNFITVLLKKSPHQRCGQHRKYCPSKDLPLHAPKQRLLFASTCWLDRRPLPASTARNRFCIEQANFIFSLQNK